MYVRSNFLPSLLLLLSLLIAPKPSSIILLLMGQFASDSTLNQFFDFPFSDFVQPNQNFYPNLPPLYEPGLNVGCTQESENRVYEIHQEQEDLNFDIENINSGISLLGDKLKINDTWDPCSSSSLDPCSSSLWNYEMHEEEQQEMDMIVLLQMEKLKTELEQRSRDYWSDVFCIVEQGMHRILIHKDQEIEKISERNTALEEKLKALAIEIQIWKKVAQTNEAIVMSLRRDLELAQVREEEGENGIEENAMSNCEGQKGGSGNHICHCCRSNEISILVLPCRHLCLCSECDRILGLCPICLSAKTASLKINMP